MTCRRRLCASSHRLCHPMGAENHDRSFGTSFNSSHKHGALLPPEQVHAGGCARSRAAHKSAPYFFQRQIDNVDRAVDTAQNPRGLAICIFICCIGLPSRWRARHSGTTGGTQLKSPLRQNTPVVNQQTSQRAEDPVEATAGLWENPAHAFLPRRTEKF